MTQDLDIREPAPAVLDAARPLVADELQRVVTMLTTRFPELNRVDAEWLVTEVYQGLSSEARVRTHLIPLTLNRCRRLLTERRRTHRDGGA
ncbi:three-helix bundle dimerization domain-containing protein [Mycolicibacterium sp. 050158]|uniref:three-helix bundle dimerization domain-containing protein n=1 Tax=Mycolicibacterium sp. 050158 TaxID=3090602 RepID=UPI00299E5901|nr:hypothetical protein [Mycolicibacterium sp. 050158]MDX1890810.1 hypothetical protein [Mycolicibacterium sp. 050158]